MLLNVAFLIALFSEITLEQARKTYEQAVVNLQVADAFLQSTSNTQHAVLLGYRGAVTMSKAKHYNNPFKKLETFTAGKNILENAINTNSNNLELRYLRFSVQTYCPAFLGYNNMDADKLFLLTNLPNYNDTYFKNKIIAFMLQSKLVNVKEKEALQHIAKTSVLLKP